MKKTLLSLSAMLLAGAVLASCSFTKGVKVAKPKDKGKAVDEVKIVNYQNDEITIKKDSKLSELSYFFAYYYDMTSKNTEDSSEFAFTKNVTNKKEAKYTNYPIEPTVVADNYSQASEEKYSYDIYGYEMHNTNNSTYKSYYYSTESKTKKEKADKVSGTTTLNNTYKKAGTYSEDSSGTRIIDYGVYHDTSTSSTEKSSTTSSNDSSKKITNQYLDTSEKVGDENYGSDYYGRDKNGSYVYYSISSFYDEPDNDSFYLGNIYYFEFDDSYDCNLELTDKYIIIKTKTSFIMELFNFYFLDDYRYDNNGSYPSSEKLVESYKKFIDNYTKDTSCEMEVWLSYTDKVIGHDYNDIGISYYKVDYKYNYIRDFEWNDKLFDYNNINDGEIKEKLQNKKLTKNVKVSSVTEAASNTDDYSKKIKSTKDSIKKNNDFDDINFRPAYM